MGIVTVNEENLTNIANAIREKNRETTTYKPSEMARAIQEIKGGIPEKGIVINEYDEEGYATDVSVVGFTELPSYYFYSGSNNSTDYGNVINKYLKTVRLPENMTSIGKSVFNYCKKLQTIELPSSLTSIGEYSFCNCGSITTIKIPSGVTTIPTQAFSNCGLETIELPDGLTSIGKQAFNNCVELNISSLPSSLTSIGENAFWYCSSLALTELPSGLTSIEDSAFQGCFELALSSLPSGLTSIGDYAFSNCTKVTIPEIPSGITIISSHVFEYLTVPKLILQGNIERILAYAFAYTKINTLALPNVTAVPSLFSENVFKSSNILNGTGYIYVPDTLVEDFKAATNWSTYAEQIKPISEMPTE